MPLAFPTTQEVSHIVRNRSVDPTQFIGMEFCPVRDYWSKDIEFDVLEASTGMTKAHNIGTDPKTVTLPGQSRKRYGTGYWKETYPINEEQLLFARAAGTYNQRAGRDLVMQRAKEMDDRLETRLEWLRWQPVVNGSLAVDENGVKYTVDYGIPEDNKPILEDEELWSAVTTADPLGNIDTWILLYRGTGARAVKAYYNSATAGLMAQNSKILRLLKNTQYANMLSSDNISTALKMLKPKMDFGLYDEGYTDDAGNFNPFIPDGQFIIRGQGPVGELMMDFASTISLHNGTLDQPLPGKFAVIEDESGKKKNPKIDITVGIYGLPRVFHPNWIISAKVA